MVTVGLGSVARWCKMSATQASSRRVAAMLEAAGVHKTLTKVLLPAINLEMLDKGGKTQFTVCVEGNIGSGKSTLLHHFAKFSDVEVYQEPVEKWRNIKGYNLLDLMYKDPSRWALTFQAYVQMTMVEHHLQPSTAPVKLLERSLYSGRYCFVENLYREGKMSNIEYSVYAEWFKIITQLLNIDVDLIVYLRTEPEILHKRIQQRARSEEQTIPLQYLQDLHTLHEDWLTHCRHPLPAPVLTLDANDPLPVMYKKFEEHTTEILCKKLEKQDRSEQEVKVECVSSSPIKAVV